MKESLGLGWVWALSGSFSVDREVTCEVGEMLDCDRRNDIANEYIHTRLAPWTRTSELGCQISSRGHQPDHTAEQFVITDNR